METERTFLRRLTPGDAQDFYELNLDPELLKYTGDKPFDTVESAKEFLSRYDQYEKYKVGRLAVIEKASLKFIGWCGLKFSPEKDEYDLGFRFFRKYWNQGFATETSRRCIDNGFRELEIQEIVGKAMKENIPSIKVLQRTGMKFKKTFDFDGKEGVIYVQTKDDYDETNPGRLYFNPILF
jgi:RimJ/RimL family protein N-acetyltransferase